MVEPVGYVGPLDGWLALVEQLKARRVESEKTSEETPVVDLDEVRRRRAQ